MAPTGYNNSGYSNSGLSSRNNGNGRAGGSFQNNRGSLTKLSGGNTRSSSIVGSTASHPNIEARNVPKPINTSSLRKENGGQDISTVLVHRQGGKVGWGSSLQDKAEGTSTNHGDAQETNLIKTIESNPTDSSTREISTNTSPSNLESQRHSGSYASQTGNINTPWATHPSNQSRDSFAPTGENQTHDYEKRYHAYRKNDDEPQLHDEPMDEYDRSFYKVDRYSRESYNRDTRTNRYHPHGDREDILYRPHSNNSYHRNSDHQDDVYCRDSHGSNSRYTRPDFQQHYERGTHERMNLKESDTRFQDRNYNSYTRDHYNTGRPDPHDRTHNESSRREIELRSARPNAYSADHRMSDYSRDEFHPRFNRYDNSHGDSTSSSFHAQKANYRPYWEPARNTEFDAPSEVRDQRRDLYNGPIPAKDETATLTNIPIDADATKQKDQICKIPHDYEKKPLTQKSISSSPQDTTTNLPIHNHVAVSTASMNNVKSSEGCARQELSQSTGNTENPTRDYSTQEDVHDAEQQRLNQQQIVLQRVQDVRAMKKKTSIQESTEAHEPSNLKNSNTMVAIDNIIESTDKTEKEKSMEAYIAKREAERAARIEHRLNRSPRTRGVLYKRLDDGTIVNADLSESDLAIRPKGKNNKIRNSRSTDEASDYVFRRGAKKKSEVPLSSSGKDVINLMSKTGNSARPSDTNTSNFQNIVTAAGNNSAPVEKENQGSNGLRTDETDGTHSSATSSAWLAGPPPSMFKTNASTSAPHTAIELDKEYSSNKSTPVEQAVDAVSSNGLSTWTCKNGTNNKVAKGPILNSWTSLPSNDVGLYQSFNSSKQEPTPTADWNLDFALPRDLLSPTAEDHEITSSHVVQDDSVSPKNDGRQFLPKRHKTKTRDTVSSKSNAAGLKSNSKSRRNPKIGYEQLMESESRSKSSNRRHNPFAHKKSTI